MEKQNIGDKVAGSVANLVFSVVTVVFVFVFILLLLGAIVNTLKIYNQLNGGVFHLTMAPICIQGAILLVLIYIAYQVKKIRDK